ncbi:hypothetical protein [Actinomycetospora soli]|uniref:hypothetical protein n=1 Tax=Actinomycetospora soli TaxID=2893887 RepID=UPI001E440CC4|nr:hypothetical protein [Actinomycetospora soli]MCD2189402.1 hypothetical protein [Actinomycetospora soli]
MDVLHTDEDGFLLLVVREAYAGFVDPDWTLAQLQAHVARERAAGHVFGVHLGPDGADRPVEVRGAPSTASSVREEHGRLLVGDDGLWVPDYTALTMAAQFADEPVVHPDRTPHLLVPAGPVAVTARQLRGDHPDSPALELVLSPASGIGWLDV